MAEHTPSSNPAVPTIPEIQQRTREKLGCRPCRWQCEVAQAILRGDKDVVCISGTGSGKTLPFWIPLLFRPDGVQIIVTPLNILGSQNKKQLERLGISAINIEARTATYQNIQDILAGKYRVVAVNPEMAFKRGGVFESIWKDKQFMSRVVSIVWDEAHLITAWASFRPDLGEAGRLRNIIPSSIPFLLPSATMPEQVLKDTIDIVRLRRERLLIIRRSNDRPNVYLTVRKMRYPISSFRDLEFLIPEGWTPETSNVPRFIVFFDNIEDSIKAAEVVRQRLPPAHRHRVLWFNADNTGGFRERVTADFAEHKVLGLFCTDAFGMGVDIPDIELVVQWRPTCGLNALWQRLGRAARGPGREALAVLFVEPKYFDEEREAAAKRAEKRKATAARKAAEKEASKRKRAGEVGGRARKSGRSRGQNDVTEGLRGESVVVPGPVQPRTLIEDLSEYERLRVEYEQAVRAGQAVLAQRKKGQKAAASVESLAPELDHLVNAATRSTKCFRKPILAYYENDRIVSDNQTCQEGTEACPRCVLTASRVCCSLCSPDHPLFALLPPPDTPLPKSTTPRASKVDTDYKMNPTDLDFRKALHAYRREQTVSMYGRAHLHNLGYGAIMGDKILERIADCARANKIRTLEGLYKETKWNRTWELGDRVLELVNRYYPPPLEVLPASTRLDIRSDGTRCNGTSSSIPKPIGAAPRQCSACGEYGHISKPT